MQDYTTNPVIRAQFTRSLCDLAAWLDQHPDIPVPAHGATITIYASSGDDGRTQVNRVAALLGTGTCDETAHGGHYWSARNFGPVGYEIVALPDPAPLIRPVPACYQATPDTQT